MNDSVDMPYVAKFRNYLFLGLGIGVVSCSLLAVPGWLMAEAEAHRDVVNEAMQVDASLMSTYHQDPSSLTNEEYRRAIRILDHQQARDREWERRQVLVPGHRDAYRVWHREVESLEKALQTHPPSVKYSPHNLIKSAIEQAQVDAPVR